MKLIHLITQRQHRQIIRRFGRAQLVKLPNGEHELIGGSDADRTAAFEWASLFAHEVVFAHFHREPLSPQRTAHARPVKSWLPALIVAG